MDKEFIIKILKIVAYVCTTIATLFATGWCFTSCTVAYNVGLQPQQSVSQPTKVDAALNADSLPLSNHSLYDSINK